MPTPSLAITLRDTGAGIKNLETFRSDSKGLDPRYEYFIAELITLRLFAILESAIADIAYKLILTRKPEPDEAKKPMKDRTTCNRFQRVCPPCCGGLAQRVSGGLVAIAWPVWLPKEPSGLQPA